MTLSCCLISRLGDVPSSRMVGTVAPSSGATPPVLVGGCHRVMRPEEGAHVAHRFGNLFLGLLPRVDAHFRLRRETRALHGDGVGVRRHIVRQDQDGRLAVVHEIARHGEDEVRVGAVHLLQEGIDHRHCDVGPARAERRAPAFDVVVIEEVGQLRTEPAGLGQHGRDDPLGRPLQQVPDEGAADAEAQHHELRDAQVIHQAEVVVGVRVPGAVALQRAGGLAAVGVAQVRRDAAVLALELLHRVEGVVREARERGVQPATGDDHQREAGADLLVVDADVALFIKWHGSLSLHSVVFRGRSRIDQTREPLESLKRHRCAAPLLCGYSCTRSGVAGQGWHQQDGIDFHRQWLATRRRAGQLIATLLTWFLRFDRRRTIVDHVVTLACGARMP